jgi:thiol-disulfide isomerase/thioredoxin
MYNQARAARILAWLALAALLPSFAQAPKLTPLESADYRRILTAANGRVILVNFWATWCGSCRKEMPALVKLESQLKSRGFAMMTVSTDDPEQEADALAFLKRHAVTMPAYVLRADGDDKFITSVDSDWSGALPALFLYDRDGRKVKSWVGETATGEIETAVLKMLKRQ